MRNFFYFCVGLLISVGLFFVPYANAQTYVQWNAAGSIEGTLANSTRQTVVDAFGVVDKTTGHIVLKGTEVPVSVGAKVSKAAIAKAAGKIAAKAIPAVAMAEVVVELCDLLCPSGDYKINPNGDFQQKEKPGIPTDSPGTGYGYNAPPYAVKKSPSEACTFLANHWASTVPNYTAQGTLNGANACTVTGYTTGYSGVVYNQLTLQRTTNFYVPDYILATEVQTETDVLLRAEQQAKFKPLYDAMMRDGAISGLPEPYSPVKTNTPVEVNAPPVTTPEKVVSTTTKTNPDGSSDTTTKTEKTVITPTTTGTTVGDSKTTFPSQTITTSTTINNVTNNTSTETTTVNHPGSADPADPSEIEDPCLANPLRVGCAVLGDPPPAEDIPKLDVPVTVTPVVFASSAGCPSPITYELYGLRTISYQPYCDLAVFLRSIFLMIAAVTSAYIFMEAFKP
ncbi:MAG: virulence factor TspB C-terminal domain-related protein [Herminiimonas sp.]|uniref:virulence factor TspB C-terminal domain-related protein n=1 Tax=Herminiimonas sp. TaxID=1926289 RepID=UPI00271ABA3E|nr:virulence factor TspB C-terminal domain-related protein [Herminiimonas sp.]MDO9421059.1 virulence factor TspB C-terminal domain-related protein [Herminiimonas sp.]